MTRYVNPRSLECVFPCFINTILLLLEKLVDLGKSEAGKEKTNKLKHINWSEAARKAIYEVVGFDSMVCCIMDHLFFIYLSWF